MNSTSELSSPPTPAGETRKKADGESKYRVRRGVGNVRNSLLEEVTGYGLIPGHLVAFELNILATLSRKKCVAERESKGDLR
jgi:hypothetical protein